MGTVTSAASPLPAAGGSLSLARLSDEFLARQAGRGSERAFAVLYERYHQPLYRYCRSIVRNDGDAQDVLQSTFTAALSALMDDRRNAPLRPWLYRIAHNEAITVLRRRNRENAQELPDAGPQAVASAEDQAADRARWSTLMADLARLPERQRSALLLRELSGLSHEEIAITLGTSAGTAKQAIFEARQALTELAEGREMSCDEVRRRLSAGDRRVLRGRRVSAHLRDCRGCEAFAADIRARRAELRAFAPVLPSAVAADLLSRSLRAASVHGGSGAAAAGSAATVGAAGSAATVGAVGKIAGTALTWKGLTGVAVIAAAAAGATGISHVLGGAHASAVGSAPVRHVAPAAASAGGDRVSASPGVSQQVTGAARSGRQAGAHGTRAASGRAHGLAAAAALTHRTGRGTRSYGSAAPPATHRGQVHAPARGQSTTSHGRALGQSHSPAATRGGLGSAKRSGSVSTSAHRNRQTTKTDSAAPVTVTTPTQLPPTRLAR